MCVPHATRSPGRTLSAGNSARPPRSGIPGVSRPRAGKGEGVEVPGAIDWLALLARFDGRQAFVMKLAVSLQEHHADTPARLRAAAQQQDREALTFMAHSLKGASGNLEAHRLHELAKAFEAAMRAGDDIASERVDALAGTLEAVLVELANYNQQKEEI